MKQKSTTTNLSFMTKNKDLLVVGGVIVVLAGAATAYYFMTKKKEKKEAELASASSQELQRLQAVRPAIKHHRLFQVLQLHQVQVRNQLLLKQAILSNMEAVILM